MKLKGCITNKIFSNDKDYHIMGFCLIDEDESTEKTVLVFKDTVTCNLPTVDTGEWIEVIGDITVHPTYGKQLVVDSWHDIDCDKKKPKKKKKTKKKAVVDEPPPLEDGYMDSLAKDTLEPVTHCPHCGGEL